MEFNLQEFQKKISSHPKPIYLLHGEEEFLLEQAITLFNQHVVDEGTRDFNYDVFYAKETPSSNILDVIETLPMMAPRRVVIVKDVDKWNEPDWAVFDNYFEDPADSTVLVLVAKGIDKRKKTIKKLLEASEAIEFKKLYDNQVPQWIQYMAQMNGLLFDKDVVTLLHQFVGNNLMDIQSEIQKLSQYLGDRKKVVTQDIIEVVSKIKVQSVFDLSRAIGESDKAKALLCLSQLLAHGQNEVGILALVSRHIRILRLVKMAKKEGQKGAQLASRVGVSPYFLAEYEQQSKDWTDKKIEKTFKALLDTDRALKSSPLSSHIWLENFVIQTCN